ncbi:MAG: hypothetical protein ABFD07_18525 [Methanobacterium sp.]
MSNKQTGSTFEHDFCIIAHERGFWAHMMTPNKQGQPSDVIGDPLYGVKTWR